MKRSKLYDLLGAGKLRAVKHGKLVMVLVDSIREYQASWPVAKFAPPKHARENKESLPDITGRVPARRRRRRLGRE